MLSESTEATNRTEWRLHLIIGVLVGLVALFIDYGIQKLSISKLNLVEDSMNNCGDRQNSTISEDSELLSGCYGKAYGILVGFNVGFVFISTVLTGVFALAAKGSGISEIKCFLNGVKEHGWLNLKTMIIKIIGIILSVSAGMPVGKEGPMIHAGAIIGAGFPQMQSTLLNCDLGYLKFRSDHQKRDFAAAGDQSFNLFL